jgi:hypothetical protein
VVNFSQRANVEVSTDVSLAYIILAVSTSQAAKASFPTRTGQSIVIFFSPDDRNAHEPIDFRFASVGTVTSAKYAQPSNALFPILLSDLGMDTVVKLQL